MKDEKAGWKEEFKQLVFSWSFWCMMSLASFELMGLLDRHGIKVIDGDADNPGIIAELIMWIWFIIGFPVLIYTWETIRLPLWIISWVMMRINERKGSIKKLRWEKYLTNLSRKNLMGKYISINRVFSIIRIIAIMMVLIALGKYPYSYYKFIRIVVCIVCILGAYLSNEVTKKYWIWVFGAIAILFNPIMPFHFNRETWAIFDIGVAIVFSLSFLQIKF